MNTTALIETVTRSHRNHVAIPTAAINDSRVTPRALALLIEICAMPSTWDGDLSALQNSPRWQSPEQIESLATELAALGYIEREVP